MKIVEVDTRDYREIFAKPAHVYNTVEFAQLNSRKAERLHYIVFDDGGTCLGIYWDDLREHSSLRPMNLLAYRVFEHYRKQGLSILDIGPTTEEGVPNYGLCCFKKSIGCMASNKFSFLL